MDREIWPSTGDPRLDVARVEALMVLPNDSRLDAIVNDLENAPQELTEELGKLGEEAWYAGDILAMIFKVYSLGMDDFLLETAALLVAEDFKEQNLSSDEPVLIVDKNELMALFNKYKDVAHLWAAFRHLLFDGARLEDWQSGEQLPQFYKLANVYRYWGIEQIKILNGSAWKVPKRFQKVGVGVGIMLEQCSKEDARWVAETLRSVKI